MTDSATNTAQLLATGRTLFDHGDYSAAMGSALEAVVSMDNAMIHRPGALGVPTAVRLAVDSDCRWGVDGVPCPWYRSGVRLRQKAPQNWSTSFSAVLNLLAQTAHRR